MTLGRTKEYVSLFGNPGEKVEWKRTGFEQWFGFAETPSEVSFILSVAFYCSRLALLAVE